MELATLTLTDDVLRRALAATEEPVARYYACDDYGLHFGKRVETAPDLADGLWFLAIVCSWRLTADDVQSPFESRFHESTWQSVSDDQLDVLGRIGPEIREAELRAPLYDIVWLRRRSHVHARIAVESYVTCAEQRIAARYGIGERECLVRAMQIAMQIERNGPLPNETAQRIESIASQTDLPNCSLRDCLRTLLNARRGDRELGYTRAVARARQIRDTSPNLIWERAFWEIAADFAEVKDDAAARREALIEVALTYEREATQSPKQAVAAHFWQMAVHAYRKVPNGKADVDRCHREFLKAQEHIREEMVPVVSESIDIADLVAQARGRIAGKEMARDLAEFVFATRWQTKTYLREQAEAGFRKFPFQHLFGTVQFSSTGKVAATSPGTSPTDVAPERLHAEMCKQYQYFIPIVVNGTIEPMRNELLCAHNVTIDVVVELLRHSPWMPEGRLSLFAIGIYAGLVGRFAEAIHVLIPQLEHLLRAALNARGVITSSLDDEGIQKEHDLNRLLALSDIESLLGEDLHFVLRVLFVERSAYNLRNQLAHGMLPSGAFASPVVVYAWWLIFRMVAGPVADAIIGTSGESATPIDPPSGGDAAAIQ